MSSGIPVISTTRARHRPIAPPTSTATTSSVSPRAACGLPPRTGGRQPHRRDERDRHAGDAVRHATTGGVVLAETGEAQDEQQRRDDVGGTGDGCRDLEPGHLLPPFWNIASIRRVTANPPKTLMDASSTATAARICTSEVIRGDLQHGADDDDAADGVRDAHERGVEGVRHLADHVEADDDRQREHQEVLRQRRRRDRADEEQDRDTDDGQPVLGGRGERLLRRRDGSRCGRRGGGGRCRDLDGRRRPGDRAVLGDQHPALDDVVEVEGELSVLAGRHQLEEVEQIGAVQLRRLLGEAPRRDRCSRGSRRRSP